MRAAVAATAVLLLATACGDEVTGTPEEFCEVLTATVQENATVFQPGDPTDPDELVDALQRLTDAAPNDIHGDMEVLTDSVESYRRALEDFDPDDPSTTEALQPLEPDEEERIQEAQESVVTFARDECGIDLEQAPSTLPPPPASTTTLPPATAPPTTGAPTTASPATAPPTTV